MKSQIKMMVLLLVALVALVASRAAASPSPFLSVSESEDFGASGSVDLAKRRYHKPCGSDADCHSDNYCSRKVSTCYKKRPIKDVCRNDYACKSGYCGRNSHHCAHKKTTGRKCFNADSACYSGYCSVVSNTCMAKSAQGQDCEATAQCSNGNTCVNGTCEMLSPTP